MNPVYNPFSPGAGSPPPELVGRESILEDADILLARLKKRKAVQGLLLTGLRGVGKTVLLCEVRRRAYAAGVLPIFVEACEEKSLGELLAAPLKKVLFELDRLEGAKDKVKKGLVALRNFIGTIKLEIGDIGLGIDPQQGFADSGDFEYDLSELFLCVAEAAADRGMGVVVIIDEMQCLSEKEIGALTMAVHRMQQDLLPVTLVAAGLPILPHLVGEAKSYAERLFLFPEVGALSEEDSCKALRLPLAAEKVRIDDEAVRLIYKLARGYPYFLQEWGYRLWNYVKDEPVRICDVKAVLPLVTEKLDANFFRVRFERLTNSEKDFLYAMAKVECSEPCAGGSQNSDGGIRISEVAKAMGVSVGALGTRRMALIRKGMIYGSCHGEIAFTVPLFGDYLIRCAKTDVC